MPRGRNESPGEDLRLVPGVGPAIEKKLNSLGIRTVRGLKGRDPEQLYRRYERLTGRPADRCLLYVFRAAVYYADNEKHDPELLKWWRWKDE